MKAKISKTDIISIAIVAIVLSAAIYLMVQYVLLPSPDQYILLPSPDQNEECAWYDITYLHISGQQLTKRAYLSKEGIRIRIGLCDGKYVAYDASSSSTICGSVVIWGATDILKYAQIE